MPLTNNKIIINDLLLNIFIGVNPDEKHDKQRILIDIELELEPEPHSSDDISEVLSYDVIVQFIDELSEGPHIELLETLGHTILDFCITQNGVIKASVKIKKPDIYDHINYVAIELKAEA